MTQIIKDNKIIIQNEIEVERLTGKPIYDYTRQVNHTRLREQLDFIAENFYTVSGNGQSPVYKMRQAEQGLDATKVQGRIVYQTVYERFEDQVEPLLKVGNLMLYLVPPVVNERYDPSTTEQYTKTNNKRYANTYIPPKYSKQTTTIARPKLWQEYLDRIMPPENLCWFKDNQNFKLTQQDYFEQWIAQRITQPHIAPEITLILRGDQGTGKSFVFDMLLKKLIGESNYQSVSLEQIKSKFKSIMWRKTLIQIEELNDSRNKVSETLKQLITQTIHLIEDKNVPQYQAEKHFGIVITSNEKIPLLIEKNDRRYFIPKFCHVAEDTQNFFQEFANYLEYENGYQQMFDHFHSVDLINFDIRKAPFTEDKEQLMIMKTTSDQQQERAMLLAHDNKEKLFFPATLQSYFHITMAVAQQALKDAGFVPYQSRRRWIDKPITAWKHKDTKSPYCIWNGDKDPISIPEEPKPNPLSAREIRAIQKENRNIR